MLARLHIRLFASMILGLFLCVAPPPAWAQDEEEIPDKPDEDQPAVTTGGLYSLATYPRSEHARTLTMTEGVLEIGVELGIDLTEAVVFETYNPVIGARYGLSDSFQLEAGVDLSFSSAEFSPGLPSKLGVGPSGVAPFDSVALWAGAEIAIAYDLVDFRIVAFVPVDPEFLFDIALGLPFKFRVNPKIAILGMEEVLIIHTGDTDGDGETNKPDLHLSLAGLYQVIDPLAIIVRASLYVGEFKFSEQRRLPIDLDILYSISNQFDVGVGVTLTNLVPPGEGSSPTDQRAFRIFGRFRI
jgi:hypothetical protein